MKKKLYPITILLITAAFGLSSCLKESKYYVNLTQGKPLAELPLASYNGGSGNLVPEALAISSTPTVLPTIVNIASVSPLSTATTITLELDTAAVTAYNAASVAGGGSGGYALLPAADYSVTSWTVTVPAGQHTATFNISINTSLVDPSALFILPIKIASASGLTIDQYNELLYNIQAKNQYDGDYTVTGTLTDSTVPTDVGDYPETVQLQTATANSNIWYDTTEGFYHLLTSAAGVGYYGNFAPIFTFSGNAVTGVTNFYGQGTNGSARAAALDPNGINKFTTGTPGAAGSVFQVSYWMVQAGANRTHFVETFTFTGER